MDKKRDRSGSRNPNWKGGLVSYICEYCGTTAKQKPSAGKKRFCSLTCANKFQKENPYKYPERKVRVEINCKYCGSSFYVRPSRVDRRKFCSKSCHYTWRSKRLKGSKNHNWHGGASKEPYPSAYFEIRNLVLQRDDSVCQNTDCKSCGTHINVHHIDYIKDHCSLKNLITLCASCNGRANFNREWWTHYFRTILSEKYGYCYQGTAALTLTNQISDMPKIKPDQIRLYQGSQYAFLIDLENERVVKLVGLKTDTARKWRSLYRLPKKMESALARAVAETFVENKIPRSARQPVQKEIL
jgi:hypothetical protein